MRSNFLCEICKPNTISPSKQDNFHKQITLKTQLFKTLHVTRRQNLPKNDVMALIVRDWHSIHYRSPYVSEQKPSRCHLVTSREI